MTYSVLDAFMLWLCLCSLGFYSQSLCKRGIYVVEVYVVKAEVPGLRFFESRFHYEVVIMRFFWWGYINLYWCFSCLSSWRKSFCIFPVQLHVYEVLVADSQGWPTLFTHGQFWAFVCVSTYSFVEIRKLVNWLKSTLLLKIICFDTHIYMKKQM